MVDAAETLSLDLVDEGMDKDVEVESRTAGVWTFQEN